MAIAIAPTHDYSPTYSHSPTHGYGPTHSHGPSHSYGPTYSHSPIYDYSSYIAPYRYRCRIGYVQPRYTPPRGFYANRLILEIKTY